MQNRHTVQIRFRNIFLAKEPPFQSRFDFNIEIEIRHLQILIITLRLSLCFNHIASCRKSRYHCPCHKSDKKTSRHTLFQETAGGYSASAVLYSYDFYSSSATHSKCRGTTPLMSEVFNFFVFRNYPQNRFGNLHFIGNQPLLAICQPVITSINIQTFRLCKLEVVYNPKM